MKEVIITGVGAYAPSKVITNDDLSKIVDTDDEWIYGRTGIKERRISIDEDTSDIAINAAKEAIDRAGLKADDIELIILATVTPDMFTPATACIVQKGIGAHNATAFDINAACSGFMYAVEVATSMIKTGNYKHALVIGAETLSKIIDWNDRRTCVLFGDGGGAAVLSASEEKIGIINTFSKSIGEKGDCLTAGALDIVNPFVKEIKERNKKIEMDGREVFRFATSVIVESVHKVLEGTEIDLEDVQYIVPHQANIRIIEYSAKKLGVSLDKFFINLSKYGNTSSASIPIALNELVSEGKAEKGDKIILVGFGGGLTYGAILLQI